MPENQYSQRIPSQTWELHKPTILRLYLSENRSLITSGGVKDTMLSEHGFLATKSQYETRLKKWRCYKYAAARDRRTKAAVRNDQRTEGLGTERHTKRPDNDTRAEAYSFSQNIAIGTSPPHRSTLQPSPRSPLSPRSSSLALTRGFHNIPSFSVRSANVQSPISPRHEVESLTPQNPTRTSNASVAASEPSHSALSIDLHDMGLPGDSGTLVFSQNATYAGGFIRQNESGRSTLHSCLDDFPLRERISSSRSYIPNFTASMIQIISRMFPRTESSARMIVLGNSSAFDSELRNMCHEGTLQLVRQESIQHQIVYMVFHRLINDRDAVRVLNQPETELDHIFKTGITYCFSLGKHILTTIVDTTPSPYDLALTHNMFRAALVLGNATVLKIVLEMNRASLTNRPLLLEDSKYYPLEYAVVKGHIQVTQVLLDHGADPNRRANSTDILRLIRGMPPGENHPKVRLQILRLLIGRGLEVGSASFRHSTRGCNRDELSVLVTHQLGKSFETFFHSNTLPDLLLYPEWNDSFSKTIKAILDQASSQSTSRQDRWNSVLTASLSAAVLRSFTSTVDILLSMGATPDVYCLISAVRSNDVQIFKDFLDRGLDPNTRVSKKVGDMNRIFCQNYNMDFDCTALSESIASRSRGAFQVLQEQRFVLSLSYQPAAFALAFVAACQTGDSALIEQLLSMPNFPRREPRLEEAIEAAMEKDQYHIIEKLLSVGMKPTLLSLELAIQRKQLTTVILLARYVDMTDTIGMDSIVNSSTVLWEALRWGNQTAIELVLRTGLPIHVQDSLNLGNLKEWNPLLEVQPPSRSLGWLFTPLSAAILGRNTTAVKLLLAYGVQAVLFSVHGTSYRATTKIGDTMVMGKWIVTPLAAAVVANDLPLIREILRMGADPFDNCALFVCAMIDSEEEIVALLLSAFKTRYPDGARFFGSDALYRTMRRGNARLLELLAKEVDLTGPVEKDRRPIECPFHVVFKTIFTSPLGEAVRLHSESVGAGGVLDYLLPLVQDPDAVIHKTYKGGNMTPLLYAIFLDSLATVRKLHQAGANISLPAEYMIPRTPLQAASEVGNKDIIEYLLSEGADPNEPPAPRSGATALQLAAITGNIAVATILLDAGADINAPPAFCDGRTAFEGATEHGRMEMMVFLVDCGADLLSNGNEQYLRAVEFAKDNSQEAAKMLADKLFEKALANQVPNFIDMGGDRWDDAYMSNSGDFAL